jgi:hypothetical protein
MAALGVISLIQCPRRKLRRVVCRQATQTEALGDLLPVLLQETLEPKLSIARTPGGGTFWQELLLLVAEYDAVPHGVLFYERTCQEKT